MTRYEFSQAVSAFFHIDTEIAKQHLPAGLQFVETHPGEAVLNITVFDFIESEVGPYCELVISLVTVPWAGPEQPLPHSAFFPIFLATTTEASRQHAAERWKLPEHEQCVQVSFVEDGQQRVARVTQAGAMVLELAVHLDRYSPSQRSYQAFSQEQAALFRVNIDILGPLSEHEDELGSLTLGNQKQPMGQILRELIEDTIPFREQHMTLGEQQFAELIPHQTRR